MANLLNRVTKQLIKSGNTPDYSVSEWIINPDLSDVEEYHSKYWVIIGDDVALMSESARNDLDTENKNAETEVEKTAEKERIDNDRLIKSVVKVVMDELNILRNIEGLQLLTPQYMRNKIKGEINNG